MDLRTEGHQRPRVAIRLLLIAMASTLTSFAPLPGLPLQTVASSAADRAPQAVIAVTVPIGERNRLALPDGTELLLNTGTQLRATVRQGSRQIAVEHGELLARVQRTDVKEYSALPVLLHAGDTDVEVSEATLRVRVDADGTTTVDVLSGASLLRPSHLKKPVKLIAGQTAVVQPGTLVITAYEPADVQRALAWQDGQIIFQGQTLGAAVAEFNRYNRRKLVVVDSKLLRMRVGGRFEATDVDGFVSALRQTFGVRAMAVRSGGAGASVVLLTADQRSSI